MQSSRRQHVCSFRSVPRNKQQEYEHHHSCSGFPYNSKGCVEHCGKGWFQEESRWISSGSNGQPIHILNFACDVVGAPHGCNWDSLEQQDWSGQGLLESGKKDAQGTTKAHYNNVTKILQAQFNNNKVITILSTAWIKGLQNIQRRVGQFLYTYQTEKIVVTYQEKMKGVDMIDQKRVQAGRFGGASK